MAAGNEMVMKFGMGFGGNIIVTNWQFVTNYLKLFTSGELTAKSELQQVQPSKNAYYSPTYPPRNVE
ncbi:hypothetical protein [[Phormidium] sp. ETS-05]|uniref:hypothetical protein n=1 Tax=[Phormidium] sp. ETS-05 TaxID=222819 RepID=UPI0018EF2922|nr:hypothetical protein [[Phormidium] sp. ETS-05]